MPYFGAIAAAKDDDSWVGEFGAMTLTLRLEHGAPEGPHTDPHQTARPGVKPLAILARAGQRAE